MTAPGQAGRRGELVTYYESALQKIAKKEGRFSMDHHEHAVNAVEDMAEIAETALAGTWIADGQEGDDGS